MAIPEDVSLFLQDGSLGCYGHPTQATHMEMASIVQDFVANMTSWDPVGTGASFLYNN